MSVTQCLVTRVESPNNEADEFVGSINPEWGLAPRHLQPEFAQKGHEVAYLSYLERKISRNPRDLMSHTQRVFLFHREKDKPACHDALLDLYLALGDKGYELRKSVLLKVKNSLARSQREFFARYLKVGMSKRDTIGLATGALLSDGVEGGKRLIALKGISPTENDLKEVAYALLEQDKVEESCRVWEKILSEDPGSSAATMELLSIYQHYGLRDDFFKTYMDLSGRKLALRELWRHLDKHFRKRNYKKRATAR